MTRLRQSHVFAAQQVRGGTLANRMVGLMLAKIHASQKRSVPRRFARGTGRDTLKDVPSRRFQQARAADATGFA